MVSVVPLHGQGAPPVYLKTGQTMNFELNSPLDMHIHFREGDMLKTVAPLSASSFAGGVIMPNLVPPVDSKERLLAYREEIQAAIEPHSFDPYMTLFFKNYSASFLEKIKPNIIGIKLYPAGATTNSESGVKAIDQAEKTIEIMQELGIPLMVHGESDGFVMDREKEFIGIYEYLARKYPRLQITMEHITTAAAVNFLERFENVSATVTLQHLLITLDDVVGGLMQPHHFCKPIAKRPEDREALLEAALNAHPKLMFGSDSAPHPISKKETCGCAAGVFTAPIALQILVDLFEKHGKLENLQAFVSDRAREIYGITPPPKKITFTRKPFTIPAQYGTVVPFRATQETPWSIVQ